MAQAGGRARELQRNAVRAAITDAATALFLERGYDETTVDDIAAAVGVSVRTLFRYMATKEETLLAPMTATGAVLAGRIRAAAPGQPAWSALIDVVAGFAAELAGEGERGKARSRLMVATPQLRGGLSDKRRVWLDEMSPAVAERLPGGADAAVVARAMVASALAALDVAAEHWAFAAAGLDLPALFRRIARSIAG
jgi:AcrR family transcriptional regulator